MFTATPDGTKSDFAIVGVWQTVRGAGRGEVVDASLMIIDYGKRS